MNLRLLQEYCKFQDPESVLASFREEWQRELEGAQVQKGLCNVSMQSSPSKEATQGSSSHNKGALKAVQSAPTDNGSRAIVHINVIKLSQREVVHESNYLGSTLCGVQKHKRD